MRETNDFYRTPDFCTWALLKRERFEGTVWEPACGDGAIGRVIGAFGRHHFATDLIYRGYGVGDRDFLQEPCLLAPNIITNPPYKLADDFVLHARALGATKIAMLLRLAWLEGEKRRKRVFVEHPPSRIWVFSGRQTLWRGDDPNPRTTGGATAYAWFVWDGTPGTSVDWIPAE